MREVASPVPFGAALTLPNQSGPLTVVAIANSLGQPTVTLSSPTGLAGFISTAGFTVSGAGGPAAVTSVFADGNDLQVVYDSFSPATQVTYDGSNGDLNSAPGGVLGVFDLAVPFP